MRRALPAPLWRRPRGPGVRWQLLSWHHRKKSILKRYAVWRREMTEKSNPRQIVLDTNFLLIPAQFGVDIFSEIDRVCAFRHKIAVMEGTLKELEHLAAMGTAPEKREARLAPGPGRGYRPDGPPQEGQDGEPAPRPPPPRRMFYKLEVKDHIRVPPDTFNRPLEEAVVKRIKKKYDGFISKDLGIVIDVSGVKEIGEGIIIPGDGASYYEAVFILLTFKPEMQEVVLGKVRDIAEFGAFMNLGPIEGMIHISQTMDDFVSFSNPLNPKLGLTMRQQGLGKLEWVKEDQSKKAPAEEEKPTKEKKK